MEFGQRRRRLRGDLAREDEFEGAYGRSIAAQSAWGRTVLAFRRVRRESPVVWDVLLVVIIIALALGADIYYISNTHKDEIKSVEETFKKQIKNLEDKYKAEIDTLSIASSQHKEKFIDEHGEHTKEMRRKQKEYLEEVVGSLNNKLKDLVDAADLHWDDHDNHIHSSNKAVDDDLEKLQNIGGTVGGINLDLSNIKNTNDLAKALGISSEGLAGGRAKTVVGRNDKGHGGET